MNIFENEGLVTMLAAMLAAFISLVGVLLNSILILNAQSKELKLRAVELHMREIAEIKRVAAENVGWAVSYVEYKQYSIGEKNYAETHRSLMTKCNELCLLLGKKQETKIQEWHTSFIEHCEEEEFDDVDQLISDFGNSISAALAGRVAFVSKLSNLALSK